MISREMEENLKRGNGIRRAFNEAERQRKIYGDDQVFDLSIGNPMAPVPEKVKETMRKFAEMPDLGHQYMCEAGYEGVRREIADSLNERYQTSYEFENIVMTSGVAGGINLVLNALLDPDDEVVIFKPYYPAYVGFIKNRFGRVVTIGPKGEGFQPDLGEFEEKLTRRTKVVIVNSPHNPSGTIYTSQTAERIASILEQKEKEYGHAICLLSDEPYRELVYDGTKLPWWPDVYDNTIVSYSFSKSLSLAGERIGYLLIPPAFAEYDKTMKAVRMSMARVCERSGIFSEGDRGMCRGERGSGIL